MAPKTKKRIFLLLIAAAAALCLIWLFEGSIQPIADTNGPDDFSLQEITEDAIRRCDVGSVGGPSQQWDSLTQTTTYSADSYTGVSEIYGENLVTNQLEITVNHAAVTRGNFRLVLLVNDEIVHDFALNELTQTYTLENVAGYVALRIAGESAAFQFDFFVQ